MSNRLWLFVFLAFCCSVRAQCPDTSQYIRWSANASWNTANATVSIAAGQKVLLDVAPSVVLGVIQVRGTLFVSNKQMELQTQGIVVYSGGSLIVRGTLFVSNKQMELQTQGIVVYSGGSLIVGTPTCPITAKLTITLFGRKANAGSDTLGVFGNVAFGSKGIAVAQNGSLQMNGYVNPLGPLWCRLSKTAMQGDKTLTLDTPVYWNVDDSIVISSTDFSEVLDSKQSNPPPMYGAAFPEQSETAVISSISADKKTLTLKTPLSWMHWGANYERAEVGLLNRNIVVRGDNTSESELYGGHVLLRHGQILQITGVEFTRMGQQGILGRYPVHFHMAMDVYDITAALINSSLHDNYQRCISIHGTNGVLVKQNVAYKTYGHCYFLEDGSETNNTFDGNLGVYTKLMNPPLIPSDVKPSMFWITHPQNSFINNAASSTFVGFWVIPPDSPLGTSGKIWPNMKPRLGVLMGPFDNNVAHSCYWDGFQAQDGQDDQGVLHGLSVGWNPANNNFPNTFTNFIGYKCRRSAFWAHFIPRGLYRDSVLLDAGQQLFTGTGVDSPVNFTFVGESENYGLAVGNRSRSIPTPNGKPDYVGGFRCYDNGGGSQLINCTFINFTSSAEKMMGGFVNSDGGQYGTYPDGACFNCKFIHANPMVAGTDRSLHSYNTVKNGLCFADASGAVIPGGGWFAGNQSLYDTFPGAIARPETNGYLLPSFHGRLVSMHMHPNVYAQDTTNPWISTDTAIYEEPEGPATVVRYRPLGSASDGPFLYTMGKGPTPTLGYWSPFCTDKNGRRVATIPYLDLSILDAKTGDWNVVVFPVPRGVQYNVTYRGVALPLAPRWEDLSPGSVWYNNTNQHLYILVNADYWSFSQYAYKNDSIEGYTYWLRGMDYIQVRASCTLDQCSLPGKYVIPAMPSTIPYVLRYDKYRLKFKTPAGQPAGESQVYLQLYPSSFLDGPAVGFQIWHTAPGGAADLYASWEDRSTGLVLADNVVGQTAFFSMIRISRAFWQAAVDGNLQMSIRSIADGRQLLVGVFKLEDPTAAFVPPSSPSACATPSYDVMNVYTNGSFTSVNNTAMNRNVAKNSTGADDRQAITVPCKYTSLEFYIRTQTSYNNYNFFNISLQAISLPGQYSSVYIVPSKSADFIINSHGWSFVRLNLAELGGNVISSLTLKFNPYYADTTLLVDQLSLLPASLNDDHVLKNGGNAVMACVFTLTVLLF
ncbi:hypothetical protein PROFUN_03523 [Planoprotostelium fungivorum]|uniref:G8 domain-containing protein n=1 Tax=Planoprotostelium fungivorum TaxID=1890364 RepID=A0A2P6MNB4_9EUKA|nr:hypothetical protein PROFUN_03523 [Planoprotostelium fungivorum]